MHENPEHKNWPVNPQANVLNPSRVSARNRPYWPEEIQGDDGYASTVFWRCAGVAFDLACVGLALCVLKALLR